MQLKSGVKLRGLRPELVIALIICDGVYSSFDVEMVVTSVNDSTHGRGSLHFNGSAFDLRTRNIATNDIAPIFSKISKFLGAEFDAVLENDHIHVEYQPKD